MVGIENFNIIARIDDLNHYSKNHYEITKPNQQITKLLSTLSLDLGSKSDQYSFFVINENFKLIKVSKLFILENKQILILISKSITYPLNKFPEVEIKILDYLNSSNLNNFLKSVANSSFRNLEYANYSNDWLP